MKTYLNIFFIFVIFLLVNTTVRASTCPNFKFEKNWEKSDHDLEIKVLQELLNTDARTRVADVGPGSPGQETEIFGVATREALKRFQALFIEYIEVADGKFNEKTRAVANKVCRDGFLLFSGNDLDSNENEEAGDMTPLSVSLNTDKTEINSDGFLRINVSTNKPLESFPVTAIVINGGNVSGTIKLSPTTFAFTVIPDGVAKEISAFIEADSLVDKVGLKNENASNEIVVKVNIITTSETGTIGSTLDSLLEKILGSAPSNDCSTVSSVDINDVSNPCYGKVPYSGGSQNLVNQSGNSGQGSGKGGGQGGGSDMMQMLTGLMGGLGKGLGGLGGGQGAGGSQPGGQSGSQGGGQNGTQSTGQPSGQGGQSVGSAQPQNGGQVIKREEEYVCKCEKASGMVGQQCTDIPPTTVVVDYKSLVKGGGNFQLTGDALNLSEAKVGKKYVKQDSALDNSPFIGKTLAKKCQKIRNTQNFRLIKPVLILPTAKTPNGILDHS